MVVRGQLGVCRCEWVLNGVSQVLNGGEATVGCVSVL